MEKRENLYPGKKIDKTQAAKMLNDINRSLQKIGKQVEKTKTEIDMFCNEPDLSGDGFKSIKTYFSNGHGSLLTAFYSSINAVINSNMRVSRKITSTITHGGKLDYTTIYNGYEKTFNLIQSLESDKDRLLHATELNFSAYSSVCSDLREQKRLLSRFEEYLDELDAYFGWTEGGANSIWAQLDNLAKQMNSFKSSAGYDATTGKYIIPNSFDTEMNKIFDALKKITNDNKYEIKDLDPVNMATGNYIYNKRFLEIPGRYPVDFVITYNSASNYYGANFSYGWTHNFDVRMTVSDASALITIDNGRQESYILKNGIFVNEHGDSDRILEKIESDEECSYRYKNEKKETYYFSEGGYCIRIEHGDGQLYNLTYEGGHLKYVRTNNECGYDFVYENYSDANYVRKIIDTAGRVIEFIYEKKEIGSRKRLCLVAITDEESATYKYGYDDCGRMNQVTNARGIVNLINTYDISGRVMNQIFPDDGECTLSYNDSAGHIDAILQNGNDIRYFHDDKARSTKTVYENGTEEYTFTDSNARASYTDKNGNRTTYEYNEYGDLIKETDPKGNVYGTEYDADRRVTAIRINDDVYIQTIYDDAGNPIEEIDALGRRTIIEHSKDGFPVKTIYADGSIIQFAYDDKGNITELVDENGNKTSYIYDSLNRVIEITDANGNSEQYSYNNRNEITSSINAAGDIRTFEYNESGKIIHCVDYDGNEEFAEYNELNKICAYIDKDGNRTEYGYDIMWNLSSIKDAEGNVSLRTYDKYGNIARETNALHATTSYSYDAEDNLKRQKYAEGAYIDYEYDSLNRMTKAKFSDGTKENFEYDVLGNVTKFIDFAGSEWIYEYNLAGELNKETNPEGLETVYTYDLKGNLVSAETEDLVTKYEYDRTGNLTKRVNADGTEEEFAYDANGNVIGRIIGGVHFSFCYDCLDRLTEVKREGQTVRTFEYDKVGNRVAVTDALGNATRYIRSKAGDILIAIDPLGHETHYTYDKCHRLIGIDQGEGRLTTYTRDRAGNVLTVTDALGNTESYEYDCNSNVIAKTDMDGNRTVIKRNIYGDITKMRYADSTEVEYSYDSLRRLKEVKDSLGITTIERDRLGRETRITDHKGRAVSYSYDRLGNRDSIKYANRREVRYIFDETNRLSEISTEGMRTVFTYDALGRLTSRRTGEVLTELAYNEEGRLRSLINTKSGNILDSYRYSYNAKGDVIRTEQTREGLADETGVFEYEYDSLNRLTGVSRDNSQLRQYTYDAFGNRTSKLENGVTTSYTYNALNQLVSMSDNMDTTAFRYDNRGNLVERIAGESSIRYIYNAANRLSRTVNGDKKACYSYNGLGFRISRETDERSVDYILDQTMLYNNILEEADKDYVWADDTLIATSENIILSDRLNTPIRYTGQNDSVMSYDEFGLPITMPTDCISYTGYRYDDISGTYFAQAREYMPETGRFVSRDLLKGRVERPVSLNEYAYCHGNPIGFVDLNGMKEKTKNLHDFTRDYTISQGLSSGIDSGTKHIPLVLKERKYNKLIEGVGQSYDDQYRAMKEALVKERKTTNNPHLGSGRLGNITKAKKKDVSLLKAERDLATGKAESIASRQSKIASSAAKGAIVGGVVDATIGGIKDYTAGASTDKMLSNMGVNFAFGAVEGTVITAAFAVNPLLGAGAVIGIGLYEYFSNDRERLMNAINSLD